MDKSRLPKTLQPFSEVILDFYIEETDEGKSYFVDLTECTNAAAMFLGYTMLCESRLRDFVEALKMISEEVEYRRMIGMDPVTDERKLERVHIW